MILITADGATVKLDVRTALGLAGGSHLTEPERESTAHPPVLAERLCTAANRNIAYHRLGGENRFSRLRPRCTLVDPAANQADLPATQRRRLAFRRHLGVLDQTGDVMDERAVGAVAGQDRDAEFATLERRLAAGHPVIALGILVAVALEAGTLQ